MIYLGILVALIYSAYTYIGYSPSVKNSQYYFPLGLTLMISAHVLWLTLAKRTLDTNKLYYYGLLWDILSTLSCYLIPIIFCGVRLSYQSVIGATLILVGLSLIRN